VAHLTVGDFRNWLLSDAVDSAARSGAPGITPEMAAAVSKIMRNQDLIWCPKRCQVVTAFQTPLVARTSVDQLQQPPTDDAAGIAWQLLDGLLYGSGDAVIGINPATDNDAQVMRLVSMMDEIIRVTASRHSRAC
jgi:ethanolamine ammonia-lyase large subunit